MRGSIPVTVQSFRLLEKSIHILDQAVEILFYDAPYNQIINGVKLP